MCERIGDVLDALRRAVSSLDSSGLSPAEAVRMVEVFSEAERLSAAGRTLAAGRVSDTSEWRSSGHRTAAQWMAARTGETVGQAITTLETARHLGALPETRSAFIAGRLSERQAAEIASAAAADPSSEMALLAASREDTFVQLRERCRAVRAAAVADEDAVERIRLGRYLRSWTDHDGAVRVDARLTPDDGARFMGGVHARAARLQQEARRSGQRERAEAYAADALVALAGDGGGGPGAVVHLEVDASAFSRGRTKAGERCVIRGIGSVPVAVARKLASAGVVKVIERDGVDVRRVTHLGRTIPAHVRSALEARDPTCVVPGCDVRSGLEIDHIVGFAEGGPTSLANLARLCRYHHAQKTHHGWGLGGSAGAWTWKRVGRSERSPPAEGP